MHQWVAALNWGFYCLTVKLLYHIASHNQLLNCWLDSQTQEREAKAEMRRKAKELQQARRDAERSGKKVPAFGGFGSAGMTSISSGSIITDTIVEPEKPKITPAPVRYYQEKYLFYCLLLVVSLSLLLKWILSGWNPLFKLDLWLFFPDQVDQAKHLNWALKGKRWTTLLTSSNLKVKPSCRPQERGAQMLPKLCHHLSMWRGTLPSWFTLFYFYCLAVVFKQSPNICLQWLQLAKREHNRSNLNCELCVCRCCQENVVAMLFLLTRMHTWILCDFVERWGRRHWKFFSQMKADRKLLVSPVSELLGIVTGKNISLFRWG